MKVLSRIASMVLCVALCLGIAYAQPGSLPGHCVTFKDVKFAYVPKGDFQYGYQKVWVQIHNGCAQELSDLKLRGYVTKDPAPQNWTYSFGYSFSL